MNKNVMIGGGVIALGVFLAFRAKKKGKEVPFIGRFIPAGEPMSNAGGYYPSRKLALANGNPRVSRRLWK
jgi:hypothetical protein